MQRRSVLIGLSALIAAPVWAAPDEASLKLIKAAQDQVGVTFIYDGSYRQLDFPGGDIPRLRGVCTDVVIRAMRDAWDIDLQLVVNRDMKANFASYPTNWGLKRPDRNIDHRRVPNLETLLKRLGADLEISSDPANFAPADIVSWRLSGSNLPHIGIVSDRMAFDGKTPKITHNIGLGARTNNMLFDHKINGHFRITENIRNKLRNLSA